MATQVQNRRGTTTEHSTFTGANGELTVDTTKKTVVVHDGTTAGGAPLLRENGSQNAVTTGTSTAASFIPTSSTSPSNGLYLPASNTVALSTNTSERIRFSSSGALGIAGANYGTSGQVLTSQGSGAAPQWASPAGGGSWVYISSATANNSASVAFTSGIDSTYDVYAIIATGVVPDTNSQLIRFRTSSNNGSSYDSGSQNYYTGAGYQTFGYLSGEMSNNTSEAGFSMTMFVHGAPSSTKWTTFYGDGVTFRNTSYPDIFVDITAVRMAASVVNAIQFFSSSGNLTTGTFRLYGIKNS